MSESLSLILSLAILFSFSSCRSGKESSSDPKAAFAPNGVPLDWGNIQPMPTVPQTAEAKLANAAARRLNEAAILHSFLTELSWRGSEVIKTDVSITDAIVSIPAKLLSNDGDAHNHPFGDGQKNASVGWVGWPAEESEPPLVMTLARGKKAEHDFSLLIIEPSFRMIKLLNFGDLPEIISGEISNDTGDSFKFELIQDPKRLVYRSVVMVGKINLLRTSSRYPSRVIQSPNWLETIANRWAWPRVKVRFYTGWKAIDLRQWPVLFRFPYQSHETAQQSLPPDANQLNGKPINLPPYTEPDSVSGSFASQNLQVWFAAQTEDKKVADFFPAVGGSGVHHQFKDSNGVVKQTAVGGVDTYVVKNLVGKTQVLYTCFAPRNPEGEAQWGAPSGAGWHSIGHDLAGQPKENWTFAETVINSFEHTGIFAGWGVRTPYPYNSEAPFEAKDVVTFRILRAGEAYTTAKSHFHWYAVDAKHKVCTVIWKHLGCELENDQKLRCKN